MGVVYTTVGDAAKEDAEPIFSPARQAFARQAFGVPWLLHGIVQLRAS